jgi:hypothetical protein
MAILLNSAMSVKNRLAATIPNDLIGIAKIDSVSVKTLFYKTGPQDFLKAANVSPKDTVRSLVFPIPSRPELKQAAESENDETVSPA